MIPDELRAIQARQLVSALKRDFFKEDRVKGDHHIFIRKLKDGTARVVTVPYSNEGDTFAPGTLGQIFRAAGWTKRADFVRVKLLRPRNTKERARAILDRDRLREQVIDL
jgi:predicted RNA binding protein YcfA (HicA-like mRNA interferase family)